MGLNSFRYRVGPSFAGASAEVVVQGGLVEILHQGVLVRIGPTRPPTSESDPS